MNPRTLELAARHYRLLAALERAHAGNDRRELERLFASVDPIECDEQSVILEANARILRAMEGLRAAPSFHPESLKA